MTPLFTFKKNYLYLLTGYKKLIKIFMILLNTSLF